MNPAPRAGWSPSQRASGGVALALAFAVSGQPVAGDWDQGLVAYHQGDYQQAYRYFRRDAELGDARAQHLLGTMYQRGLGIPENEYEGFYWCKRAADEGLLEAQFQVGLMYLQGEGVTESEEEAMKWLWEAADRGYPQATEVLQFIFTREVEYGC